jgi:hypothetical protein
MNENEIEGEKKIRERIEKRESNPRFAFARKCKGSQKDNGKHKQKKFSYY